MDPINVLYPERSSDAESSDGCSSILEGHQPSADYEAAIESMQAANFKFMPTVQSLLVEHQIEGLITHRSSR